MPAHFLDTLFAPRSVAVVGASERSGSVGGQVFQNVLRGRARRSIVPVNPKHNVVFGVRCFASVAEVPEQVGLAVVATPASTVHAIVAECGERGVPNVVVLSAGFGEGGRGVEERARLVEVVRRYRLRLLGPNCLGLIRPSEDLNATFSRGVVHPGSVALVSQSGALITAILDWAEDTRRGFSAVVSLGATADIDFGDLLDFLALDTKTESILLYVEGVADARAFMSGLRAASRLKPVICVKAGRHASGSRAALSHTGALVGSDDVFEAALRRAGGVRAMTIEQLFAASELLSAHHRVSGNRLAILTNAGGPGVMAADHAPELGIELATLGAETLEKLDRVLPPQWSRSNPLDLLGDAPAERYGAALVTCLADPSVDGVLAMLAPQAVTDPLACAEEVIRASSASTKPVLTCWLGRHQVAAGRARLSGAGLPTFANPESSLEAFSFLVRHREGQELLTQVPPASTRRSPPDVEGARLIIEAALRDERTTLTAIEARALLRAFGVQATRAFAVRTPNEALVAAETLGLPVAMKIASPHITHKSDVGGVRLDVATASDVRRVFTELVESAKTHAPEAVIAGVVVEEMHRRSHGRELLVGAVRDPVFGPALSFGSGGVAVEITRDRAVALPPLNTFLAEDLMRRTRAWRLLDVFRGHPAANREAVVDVLLAVSEMVSELPEIVEIEFNPLIVDERSAVVVDVRVAVARAVPSERRYAHMAVHPYPANLVERWQLADGTDVCIRPIRPEDTGIEDRFVRTLSEESKYLRFMRGLAELTREMLVRFTQIDYDREMAFIAVLEEAAGPTEIGVARYVTNPDAESCEFALVVADAWQGRGIGTKLLSSLIASARAGGLLRMEGEVLAANSGMLKLVSELGFSVRACPEDPAVRLVALEL